MASRVSLLTALLSGCTALQLSAPSPRAATRASVRLQFAQPPDLSDEEIFPKGPDGKTLITFASLDKTGQEMIEMALATRNKERILAGEPKYESVEGMVDAYVEFEGEKEGLSRAQCEDLVMRFLQKRALMEEGAADLSDPQTLVTFGLLGAILIGAAYNLAIGNVELPPSA